MIYFTRIVYPDGTQGQFSFIADENGYRVESPLLPTPPPMPAHALAQIEKARLEDAAGNRGGSYNNGGISRNINNNNYYK